MNVEARPPTRDIASPMLLPTNARPRERKNQHDVKIHLRVRSYVGSCANKPLLTNMVIIAALKTDIVYINLVNITTGNAQ